MLRIIDLNPTDTHFIQQVTEIVVAGFKDFAPSWCPDLKAALEEVEESFTIGYISLIVVDEHNLVLGWVGGRPNYAKVSGDHSGPYFSPRTGH